MSKAVSTALLTLALAAGGISSAFAHHSAAMYDFTKNVWVSGVVQSIRVINPHMSLTLVVPGSEGKTKAVDFEGHSVNNFYRAGWRPNLVRVGDKIRVRYNPRKDGRDGGFVNGFVAANGREVAFGLASAPPPKATTGAGSESR
ncbi:MAG: DUF6152 family protein [Steroidobacteraceae bacterium]